MDDKQCCDFIKGCPMFAYFCRSSQIIYCTVYCQGDFATCKRRQLRLAGQPVPDSLLPQGMLLWEEGEKPPGEFQLS